MMMGVAQVIGIKPTLRSFFSGAPAPCAKTSVAVANGKNARARRARSRRRPISGRPGAPRLSERSRASPPRPRRFRNLPPLHRWRSTRAGPATPDHARCGSHARRRGSLRSAGDDRHQTDCRTFPCPWPFIAAAAAPPSILAASCRPPPVPAARRHQVSSC